MKKDWKFDFVVENITQEEADELINSIIKWVEEYNTYMGGGFSPVTADDEESDDEQEGHHPPV